MGEKGSACSACLRGSNFCPTEVYIYICICRIISLQIKYPR